MEQTIGNKTALHKMAHDSKIDWLILPKVDEYSQTNSAAAEDIRLHVTSCYQHYLKNKPVNTSYLAVTSTASGKADRPCPYSQSRVKGRGKSLE